MHYSKSVADPGEGPGGRPPPPLYFSKKIFETGPLHYLRVWMTAPHPTPLIWRSGFVTVNDDYIHFFQWFNALAGNLALLIKKVNNLTSISYVDLSLEAGWLTISISLLMCFTDHAKAIQYLIAQLYSF